MNDARRKEIQRALTLIGEAKGILELALSQEQDDLDNMPENLQGDEEGKEQKTWLTHWSVPRWAAAMRLPPARRRCRVSPETVSFVWPRIYAGVGQTSNDPGPLDVTGALSRYVNTSCFI
jgi:hypothetical protein